MSLTLPIVLSAVALFFSSFLSLMVLQLHKRDWNPIEREAEFLEAMRKLSIPEGNYVFPAGSPREMQTEEFKQRQALGPRGFMTLMPQVNMGKNLVLTFVYFLVISIGLAFLTSLAFPPGAPFLPVFRFVLTAGVMVYLAAMVSHAIWFRVRIVGHVIESLAFAAITAALFAALWPAT